jgi:hypothetical protein
LKSQHNPKEPNNINTKEIVTKLATRTSDNIREDEMNVHTSHTPMGTQLNHAHLAGNIKYICDFTPKNTKYTTITPNLMERVARLRC